MLMLWGKRDAKHSTVHPCTVKADDDNGASWRSTTTEKALSVGAGVTPPKAQNIGQEI